ncbi:MAG TPA: hypothetical protein VNI35_06695, partial [Nitrospira sp.]|nr:hypothetical protein [Nitrospira sp.]
MPTQENSSPANRWNETSADGNGERPSTVRTLSGPKLFLAVFALIAGLVLLGSGRNFLRADGMEVGDPAVNAIAIHDAIDWTQIHGNYSRWGFAHPGPAFFYWEGAWEWILCDVTGVAASPMGAHHVAMVILNSAMLAMAIVLLYGQVKNPAFIPLACAVAAVHFCMVNRGLPCAAMLNTWPPYV